MGKREVILKIAGLDPIKERTHMCNRACPECPPDCRHQYLHKPDEEECLIEDYCSETGISFGGEKCVCEEV